MAEIAKLILLAQQKVREVTPHILTRFAVDLSVGVTLVHFNIILHSTARPFVIFPAESSVGI